MSKTAFTLVILTLAFARDVKAQQVHASLSDQKMCAEQAKKFFNETDYSDNSKKPIKNEYTSHYDAATRVCYVRIDYNIFDGKTKTLNASSYVFDAFEGRNLAEYIWLSQPDKKYWEVKPMACHVKPINGPKVTCTTTEEFESLVDRLFGLGE